MHERLVLFVVGEDQTGFFPDDLKTQNYNNLFIHINFCVTQRNLMRTPQNHYNTCIIIGRSAASALTSVTEVKLYSPSTATITCI